MTAPNDQWTLIRRARQLLTLRGPSGPRRGSALDEPGIVNDAAILIHNGLIQEVGASRRVENLKHARHARVIDADGRILMPAFVDPDCVLVYPPPPAKRPAGPDTGRRLSVISRHRLALVGAAASADRVRSGVLSVGAHTGYASDLRETLRILRIHQSLQSKPLRIRSIYAPTMNANTEEIGDTEAALLAVSGKALPAIRKRKFASIIEFSPDAGAGLNHAMIRRMAIAAAEQGFVIRIRATGTPDSDMLELTLAAASLSLIALPAEGDANLRKMSLMSGCVHVLQATGAMRDDWTGPGAVRREIDEGIPIALASGFRAGSLSAQNPQFILHLAVERFGMTPAEAIMASTYNSACALRMSHVTGSLEPGKAADIVMMDVDDYRDLFRRVGDNDVQTVVRAGKVVYRRGGLTLD